MLNPFPTGMLEYLVTKCGISCFTGMLNEVFDTDAGSTFDRNAGFSQKNWVKFSKGILNDSFDNDAGLDV